MLLITLKGTVFYYVPTDSSARLFAYKYIIHHVLALSFAQLQLYNVEPCYYSNLPRALLHILPFILNTNYRMGGSAIWCEPDHIRELVLWGLVCGFYPRIQNRGRRGYRVSLQRLGNRGAYLSLLHRLDGRNLSENLLRRPETFFTTVEDFSRTIGVFYQIRDRALAHSYRELSLERCHDLVGSLFHDSETGVVTYNQLHSTCPCTGYTLLINSSDLPCSDLALFTTPYVPFNVSLGHDPIGHQVEIQEE
uniref:p0 n=1 Tax=Carrot red leaf virus TaxID=66200 RepID=A0A0A0P718_9VIRU|nr:P0 [Carrot red leaf virus]